MHDLRIRLNIIASRQESCERYAAAAGGGRALVVGDGRRRRRRREEGRRRAPGRRVVGRAPAAQRRRRHAHHACAHAHTHTIKLLNFKGDVLDRITFLFGKHEDLNIFNVWPRYSFKYT